MQASRAELVVHLHLGAEFADQTVEGAALGCADVGRREHPDRDATVPGGGESLLDHTEAVPLHERAEKVHAVRCGQFRPELEAEVRVLGCVGDKAVSERGVAGRMA